MCERYSYSVTVVFKGIPQLVSYTIYIIYIIDY